MIKDVDTKYRIVEEVECIQVKIQHLEAYTHSNIRGRKDKRRILRALKQAEKGLIKAQKILGEG